MNREVLIAEKDGRAITGEWEEIVPKIDTYEYEQARKEREDEVLPNELETARERPEN